MFILLYVFVPSGGWNDVNCATPSGYVCKKYPGDIHTPPPPTQPWDGNCPEGDEHIMHKHTILSLILFILQSVHFKTVCPNQDSNPGFPCKHQNVYCYLGRGCMLDLLSSSSSRPHSLNISIEEQRAQLQSLLFI